MNTFYNKRQAAPKTSQDFIFGTRAVIEAVLAGKDIDKILIRKNLESSLSAELYEALKGQRIPVQRVPVEKLNRVTTKNHQGVVAFLSPITYQRLEDLIPSIYEAGETPFFVLLDGITDVRNLGAIARTCDATGVHALVVPATHTAAINADAVKTSAGALNTLPVCRENTLREAMMLLKNSGVKLVATSEKGALDYTKADYSGPIALVMGAEDTGVAPEHLKLCDQLVSLPMLGRIASLNVSVAAGVLLYESIKQRTHGASLD